jgi:hypothetical protein
MKAMRRNYYARIKASMLARVHRQRPKRIAVLSDDGVTPPRVLTGHASAHLLPMVRRWRALERLRRSTTGRYPVVHP